MTILHFKVVLAAIFIKININNRKTRPCCQFYSLVTSKYVPLINLLTYVAYIKPLVFYIPNLEMLVNKFKLVLRSLLTAVLSIPPPDPLPVV